MAETGTVTRDDDKEDEGPYLYQQVGYYERDGVWYGPCVTVLIGRAKRRDADV